MSLQTWGLRSTKKRGNSVGLTLIEIVLSGAILTFTASAFLRAYLSQVTLNEHTRNSSLALFDANRVMEQLRRQNVGCNTPSANIPNGWDAWLETQNPGKRMASPNPNAEEAILVTCQNQAGTQYCNTNQVSLTEWVSDVAQPDWDLLRITVAVCWRHRNRTIGECTWDGAALTADDPDGDGVIESPVQLITLLTCRTEGP